MAINMDAVLELSAKVDGMSQLLQLEKSLSDVKGELNKYEGAQKTATTQSGLFNAATVALGGFMLDAAYKAAELVKQAVQLGFSYEQTETRLRMLSEGYGEYDAVQAIVAKNAEILGQSQIQAASGFADIYARLRPLGVSLEDVNAVYLGFNSLALQSGTTAEAASGAFMQLSQALGSGTLRGDEFNSVAEQVPGILMEVAEVMGQPVGALRELAADGKITSDVVIQAMRNAAAEGGASLGELTQSAANAGARLNVAFQDFLALVGSELVPALAPFMDGLAEIVRVATEAMVPAARMVSEAWQWFAGVLTTQLLPAFDPLIAAVGRLTGGLDVTDIALAWQGALAIAVSGVTQLIEYQVGVWTAIVDAIAWIGNTPAFRFLGDQLGNVIGYLANVRDSIIGANEQFSFMSPIIDAARNALSAVVDLASRVFQPAINGIVAGWTGLYQVLTEQVLPAFQPIIDAAQRLVGDLDIAQIVELWINGFAGALQTVTGYFDNMASIWAQLANALFIDEIIDFYKTAWVGALDLIVDGITEVSKAWAFTLDVIKQLIEDSPFAWILKQMGLWQTSTEDVGKEFAKVDTQVQEVTAEVGKTATASESVRKSAELTKEELKAQNEEQKKKLEQIKEEQKYQDAIVDQESLKLDTQMDQLEAQRKKVDGTSAEYKVLDDIRNLQLEQAKLDDKAAQDKIEAQVKLGQMTQLEADIRLETLKIQYDSTKATINQQYEQEVLNERAERQKELQVALTDQTTATVDVTEELVQKAEDFNTELEKATTHTIKLGDELREVSLAIIDINTGMITQQQDRLLNASAAYEYEKFTREEAEKILDLYGEQTAASEELADAMLATASIEVQRAVAAERMLATQQDITDELRKQSAEMSSVMDREDFLQAQRDSLAAIGLSPEEIDKVVPKFATGGYVTSPTLAMVGDGGEPEYVIPQSKMLNAIMAFLGGERGADILSQGGTIDPNVVMLMAQDYLSKTQIAFGASRRNMRSGPLADTEELRRKVSGYLGFTPGGTLTMPPVSVNINVGSTVSMNNQQYVTVAQLNNAVNQAVSETVTILTGNVGVQQMMGI